MKHTCSTLILHCIDFRFHPAVQAWLQEQDLIQNVDVVSVAGAVKNLVSPAFPTDREFILRQIDISKRLHDIQQVVLMNHTDCGAYGGRKAFSDLETERNAHIYDLRNAAQILREHLPEVTSVLALAEIDNQDNITFSEIQ